MCNRRGCYQCSKGCFNCCECDDRCRYKNQQKYNTCCACCWKWRARAIWFPPILLGIIVITLIIFGAGYYTRLVWNNNAVETPCTILKNQVTSCVICDATYDEKCHCQQDCTTGSCNTHCDTCTRSYAAGKITVNYLGTYTMDVVVIDDNEKIKGDQMQAVLNERYPVNSTLPCYYQPDNPEDFKLYLNETFGWLVATYVFIGIIGLFLFVWVIIEIVRGVKRCVRSNKKDDITKKEVEIDIKEKETEMQNAEENKSVETVKSEVSEVTVQ